MSLSPLNVNCIGQFAADSGLYINPNITDYVGTSTGVDNYNGGVIVNINSLDRLIEATRLAYELIGTDSVTNISQSVYNSLISIGSTSIPALGACKPSTYTTTISSDLAKYGFFRLIALQAHQEFYLNTGSYKDFLQSFATCYSLHGHLNTTISALSSAGNYLLGSYSNMNDLITSDITGVSLSTLAWGTDLISNGTCIDLSNIDKFGRPDVLLRTLVSKRCVTDALNLALISTNISSSDIVAITNGQSATDDQQRLIYAAFNLIIGKDLQDILIPLNCQTQGLSSLADLLDPKKLFPNSYQTLTYPIYNTTLTGPTNAKTYYLIYKDNEVAFVADFNLGIDMSSYLPRDLAYSCAAFRMSMLQIKNIQTMDIEKFSQVVTNLEPVADLPLVGGTNVPTDITSATNALSMIANGSNSDGTYNMTDFFGAMTDLRYNFPQLYDWMNQLQSPALSLIYQNIFNLINTHATPYNAALTTLIGEANTEIANILANNQTVANQLNDLYNQFGTLLLTEQVARQEILGDTTNLRGTTSDIINFMNTIGQYAQDTSTNGPAVVLESIANTNTLGGSSLIASMREARNVLKLGLTGASLDNRVNNDPLVLPPVTGTMSTLGVPIVTGAAIVPGSLAGSSQVNLIPPNLSIFNTPSNTKAVITPAQAVQQIIRCNCDCWIQS